MVMTPPDERWPYVDGKPTKKARWTFRRDDHAVYLTGENFDNPWAKEDPMAPLYYQKYRLNFRWAGTGCGEITTTNGLLAFTLARLWVIGGNREGMGWREEDWLPWEVLP